MPPASDPHRGSPRTSVAEPGRRPGAGRRLQVLTLAFLLALSACSTGDPAAPTTTLPPDPTAAPPGAPTTTTTTTHPVTARLETTDCETPPEPFAVLCEVHGIVVSRHVGELDDAVLAGGAARGLTEYGVDGLAAPSPPLTDEVVRCALPAPDFLEFCQAYLLVRSRHGPGDEDRLVEGAVRGMLDFGIEDDEYTRYVRPEVHRRMLDDQSGRFEGIGAYVEVTSPFGDTGECPVLSDTCSLTIIRPIEGGPAHTAGLAAGDVILAANDRPLDGLTLDEAVLEVRGPTGTVVTLLVRRGSVLFELEITRARIDVMLVDTEMLPGGVGYVRVGSFTRNAGARFTEALEKLLAEGPRAIVLDLQDNPGGFLEEATLVADAFLDRGLIAIEEYGDGDTRDWPASRSGIAADPSLRVVVLVNAGTASAAELVAGALQDRGRALVVGQPTFGKGSVQELHGLRNGGGLQVTIARWLTSAGRSIAGLGIRPDITATAADGGSPGILDVRERALEWLTDGR